jgi:hypothetical protein
MRDPMEAQKMILAGAGGVPDDPESDRAMQRSWIDAWGQISTLRGRTKLLSLTVDAPSYTGTAEIFGRGWARARTWQQYAENHAGVCLLFHRERFQDVVLSQL